MAGRTGRRFAPDAIPGFDGDEWCPCESGQTSEEYRCPHYIVSKYGRWCLACDVRLDETWRQAWLETGMHSPRRPQAIAAAAAAREVA